MTNQIQGELLFAWWESSTPDTFAYTPWIPARAESGTFGVEIVVGLGVTLTWRVETRTSEDPTTSTICSSHTMTSGVSFVTCTGAKELVRYRVSTGSTPSTTNFVLARALQPLWNMDR